MAYHVFWSQNLIKMTLETAAPVREVNAEDY